MKLQLDCPVLPCFITQEFGINGEWYRRNGINVLGHNGIDIMAYHGQAIYASHDGLAYYTDNDGNEGDGVVIKSNDKYEINGQEVYIKTIYWHMCDPHKEPKFASPVWRYRISTKGEPMPVRRGQLIGYADNTGFSMGDHLHYGLKPALGGEDPSTWWNTEQDNGYGGAIDPKPFLVNPQLDAADQVAVLAAKYQAQGENKIASQIWAVVDLIRAFIKR